MSNEYADLCRGRRLYQTEYKQSEEKAQSIIKWQDGPLTTDNGSTVDYATVDGQKLTLDFSKCYPDDALAIIRDAMSLLLRSNPDGFGAEYTKQAIANVEKSIHLLDKRAVERHGYLGSPKEKEVPVPY
jgi:hypothetical protein